MFFNPFFFLCQGEAEANHLFGEWLSLRMDLMYFLHPLLGKALLCDCNRGLGCHTHTLLRVLDRMYPPPGACVPHFGFVGKSLSLDPVSRPVFEMPVEHPPEGSLSDSDDSGTEVQIVTPSSRPDDIGRIDETRRGSFNAFSFGRERPAWPP